MRFAFSVVLSGALLFASSPLTRLWPLAWVAPVPVLVYALSTPRARNAAAAAFAAMLLGQLSWVMLFASVFPAPALAAIVVAPAVVFMLITLATRRASAHLPIVARTLVFPALSAALELAQAASSPHGTAGSVAYGQAYFTPLVAIAAVTGLPGITFLVTWFPSALAHVFVLGRPALRALLWPLLAVAGTCAFGILTPRAAGGAHVRVGLTANDPDVEAEGTSDSQVALRIVDGFAQRVRTLAARGAEVVVLPEKMVTVRDAATRAEARRRLAAAAREAHVTVIAGLDERPPDEQRGNVAVVFSPTGELLATYDKQHMLPPFESAYRVGHTLAWARDQVGVAICKDMDFPELGRRYGRERAGLLLVPAWDFVVDGALHERMAVLRGVEGGFAVARSAQQGRLSVSDAQGRVLAEVTTGPDAMLVADVLLGTGETLYSRWGDLFGAACAALAVSLLLTAEWRRRRV